MMGNAWMNFLDAVICLQAPTSLNGSWRASPLALGLQLNCTLGGWEGKALIPLKGQWYKKSE